MITLYVNCRFACQLLVSALPNPGSQYCELYEVRKYVFILLYILNIQGQHGPYHKVDKQYMFIELSY